MDAFISIAEKFGAPGLMFLAFGWFVIYLLRAHASERKEMREIVSSQHADALESNRQSSDAIRKNSMAITELSTLIRSLNGKHH